MFAAHLFNKSVLMFPLRAVHPFFTQSLLLSLKVTEPGMSDLIFVVMTLAFFALGILYLKGCERLK